MHRKIKGRLHIKVLLGVVLSSLFIESVSAIPAFARKNKVSCTTCHTAWPMLNSTGHKYKENGYQFARGTPLRERITEDLSWDKVLPVSTIIIARPYDKKGSGNKKVRAIHEVELMVAGPMSEKLSGFFEIEAEDEVTNGIGFDTGIPAAALTYHHNEQFNLQFSWSDLLWFSPYNTYTSNHRMTRGFPAVIDQTFGGADNNGKLRTARQNVVVYGRPVSSLFYGLAYSGVADDSEGEEAETVAARLAYDITPKIMVGLVAIDGTCAKEVDATPDNCTVDRNFSRTAIDTEFQTDSLVLTAAYMQAKDDNATATAEVENDAYFVQVLYAIKGTGRTLWAPIVRYDAYEQNNGVEDISEITLGLNYYFTENVRGMVEYWDKSGDGTTLDDDRLTLQVYAAF